MLASACLTALGALQGNREWWLRDAARDPRARAGELALALADPRWRARADALEALERAGRTGTPLPEALLAGVEAALRDGHPTVRARALAALGAGGAGAGLDESMARVLAREPLATVRLELARALGSVACPDGAARLLELGFDPDRRVASAARCALAGLAPDGPGSAEALAALVERVAREEPPEELARELGRLGRSACSRAWLERSRAALANRDAGRRALLEALAFAQHSSGDERLLLEGWGGDEDWEPVRARVCLAAARSGSESLARAVLSALDASAGGGEQGIMRRALVTLLCETLDPARALRFLREEAPGPECLAEVLDELGLRLEAWDGVVSSPWLDEGSPAIVRRALVQAAAACFTRANEPGCEELLVRALGDPDPALAARAFEVLCEARVLAPRSEDALHASWAALAALERESRLSWFTRERVFPSFRADWIALGRAGGERRATACELLAGFARDPAVSAALELWLAEDLERAAAPSGIGRALEQTLQAELRALARTTEGAARPAFHAALRGALGRSTEVGKVAAAALGRTEEGCRELAALLDAGALDSGADRRTRIESCIALAQSSLGEEPRSRACQRLLHDRPGAAWDLRERMLRALRNADLPAAREALEALALEPDLEPFERVAIVTLLGSGDGRSRTTLARIARGPFDLESRRLALRGLAGTAAGEAELLALFERCLAGELAAGAEELCVLRGELLVVLGALEPPPPQLFEEWLRAPLASSSSDNEQRQRGVELPATEFSWRHELELARVLAGRRRVTAFLARSGDWWKLDARLLVALGETCLAGEDLEGARELFEAGVIGLFGEQDLDRSVLAHAQARLLTVAWRVQRWDQAAALAAQVLVARREGLLGEPQWSRLFGAFDRQGGVDPDARVNAARWQALARVALARGELEAARRARDRAAVEVAGSRLAAVEQRALEAELDTR